MHATGQETHHQSLCFQQGVAAQAVLAGSGGDGDGNGARIPAAAGRAVAVDSRGAEECAGKSTAREMGALGLGQWLHPIPRSRT